MSSRRLIHSIGKLVLDYTDTGMAYTTSVGLLLGSDPGNFGQMVAAATELASAVKRIMPAGCVISSFHTLGPYGDRLIAGQLDPPASGAHLSTTPQWRSNTLTFSGKGQSDVDFGANGNTRMMVHVFGAYQPDTREKTLPIAGDVSLEAVGSTLSGSAVYWADFYGVKASVRGVVSQQFNAHTQKKEGA